MAAFREFGFDSYKLDSCGGQKDIALWGSLLNTSGAPVLIENCHNGPYFPEHPYKPGQAPWCPFNFYRTSVDVEVLYASIFGVNLPSTVEFLRSKLSFPGCWAVRLLPPLAPPSLFFHTRIHTHPPTHTLPHPPQWRSTRTYWRLA